MRMAAEGALNLLKVCEEVCGAQGKLHWNFLLIINFDLFYLTLKTVDLGAWRAKILEEIAAKDEDTHVEIGEVIQHVRPILSNIIFTYYLLQF